MARHRHIIVQGIGRASDDFQPHGGGSNSPPSAVPDRAAHASRLRGDLAGLSEGLREARLDQAGTGVAAHRRGLTVAVTSREGEELVTGTSRRATSTGMQLLNVQRHAKVGQKRGHDRAIYFMTGKAMESLDTSLDAYEQWKPEGEDRRNVEFDPDAEDAVKRPRNFWFFESAGEFRQATIEDLWTDRLENFPAGRGEAEWEIWVRLPMVDSFEIALDELGIETSGRRSEFVDILVYNVVATKAALDRLISSSAAVVELRGASNFIAEHADLPPPERVAQYRAIADRVVPAPPAAPWVTLLDTGVNRDNALLSPALPRDRCRAVTRAWSALDPDGHGTKMAGVVLYGDLANVAGGTGPVTLDIGLESVAVFNPGSVVRIPARDAIARGVRAAEADDEHQRVYCLAATAVGEPEDGRPTSTSSTLDKLAFNDRRSTRLFCVAVGNVEHSATTPYSVSSYHTLNGDHGIQSPAQALNVLSVGALTHKCSGPSPLAHAGGLSPRSRTAQPWRFRPKHHKPDIVMEGGNHGVDPGGLTSRPHAPDMIATTSNDPTRRPITFTGDTSAACAAAARLAGRVLARYPAMRPETVRALLVNCAEWTEVMWARWQQVVDDGGTEEEATLATLDCFGWGVPHEERVFWSAGNALTLIAQDTIRPFKKDDGRGITLKEMKSFSLPWPDRALGALGSTEVEMRCTLSYFIDPDLHSAGLQRPQLYASHGLSFDFQRFLETEARAQRRVNRAVSTTDSSTSDTGWALGWRKRNRGTIHHDVWRGPANQLVGRRLLNVTPSRVWWATNPEFSVANVPVPFSLVVSIRTPETTNDLVSEVLTRVPASALVDVPSLVRT